MNGGWQLVSERPGGSVACLLACPDEVLALSAAAVHRSVDGGSSWSTLSAGDPPAPLYALARTERSLFVGGASGLFRSRDRGSTWRQVVTGAAVTSLAVATEQTVLAGTDADGILRSDDDGDTWASGNPGLLDLNVLCLVPGFAGTATGLYRSVNDGRSWREVQLPCAASAVECASASGPTVVVGTDAAGAFISVDLGRTWSALAVAEAAITAAAVDDGRIAIAAPGGVYVSRDAGQTWQHATSPQVVLSLAFVGEQVLGGIARDGVLRSNNSTSSGLHGRLIVDLACTPRGTLLTAGIEDGIQRSTDGGRTWNTVAEASTTRLAVGGDVVYAATAEGLSTSADDGCQWTLVRDAPAIGVATCGGLAFAAFEGNHLLVLHEGEWRTREWDRGRILSLGVASDGGLFVAERGVVWRSSDTGRSWSPWLHYAGGASASLAIGSEVLAASDTRVYRLLGATSLPEPVTCIAFGTQRTVYVGTTRGVYVSADGAEHFAPWNDGLPDAPVLALQVSAGEVYALLFGGSLLSRRLP